MPLTRAALYAAGEDLRVALWPGRAWNTRDITRFVAMESRSYVVSASAVIHPENVPVHIPLRERILNSPDQPVLYDGGSCIAGPDGSWVVEPVCGREEIIVAELDPATVSRERQSFDPAGHYARPDVLGLSVDRRRQTSARFLQDASHPGV